ncbi:MAG: bifunctional adenosylcobinamide kinase/adenosylcobinamide-phosphate guanylyltransferase [Eubacteriales bacterium]|nr:bifunctional adenosylcobinamide kinase/adenosylcobinamide-phosphate guanylyltransferase [Eubacteriales bacterium]
MELIIGGAYQGKRALAEKLHPEIMWISGESCTMEELIRCQGVDGFQKVIRRELQEGRNPEALAQALIEKNPGIVLISEEVGYGVVPIDAFERSYREAVGRTCTRLASACTRVTRVICGIGTVIKDA